MDQKEIKTKTKDGVTTLSRKLGKFEAVNAVELDIVRKGEIPGLWPPEIRESMMHTSLVFSITGYYGLDSYLQLGISFTVFCSVIWKIIKTVQHCEACGIQSSNLEMSPQFIYYHLESNDIRMLYWPLISVESYTDMKDAFLYYGRQYVCPLEDQSYLEQYLAYFESRRKFDIFDFEKALISLWNQKRNGPPKKAGKRLVLRMNPSGNKLTVDQFPFSLGRDPAQCDYSVTSDSALSRKHLTLHWKNGRVFAVDEGSSNGSAVNGVPLKPGAYAALKRGSKIQIGKQLLTVEEIRG